MGVPLPPKIVDVRVGGVVAGGVTAKEGVGAQDTFKPL